MTEWTNYQAAQAAARDADVIEPDGIMVAEFASIDDAPEAYRAHFAHLLTDRED